MIICRKVLQPVYTLIILKHLYDLYNLYNVYVLYNLYIVYNVYNLYNVYITILRRKGRMGIQASTGDRFLGIVTRAIEEQVKQAATEITEKHIEQMTKEIEQRRSEIIAGVSLRVMKQVRIERMHDELHIVLTDGRDG